MSIYDLFPEKFYLLSTKNRKLFSLESQDRVLEDSVEEAFEKLPKAEQQRQQMMVVGIGIFFAIFACMLMFFVMLFGWSGVKAGIENLWGR